MHRCVDEPVVWGFTERRKSGTIISMNVIKIIVFLAIAAALVAGGLWYNHRSDLKDVAARQAAAEASQKQAEEVQQQHATALQQFMASSTEDIVVGSGEEAKNGDAVTVNYEGRLTNGTKFDSSYDRGTPFTFTLGKGEVIQGWDMGVLGMKVGGTRKLTIPPEYAYGDRAVGPIPANATLVFSVELLGVKHPGATN